MDNKRVRETKSPERIPLAEQNKSVLAVPPKPGFVRRWVNDDPKSAGLRINAFILAGWRIVQEEVQVGTEGVVNQNQSLGTGARKHVGGGFTAILMEIEKKYYDEDQATKMERISTTERAIYGGEGLSEKTKIGEVVAEDRYTTVSDK